VAANVTFEVDEVNHKGEMVKKKAKPEVRRRRAAKAVRTRASVTRQRKPERRTIPARGIDAFLKGITIATEPPINNDSANLDTTFFAKLSAALSVLSEEIGQRDKRFKRQSRTSGRFGSPPVRICGVDAT